MKMAKGEISDILVMRLKRGDEIIESIKQACREYNIKNATIINMIGSLKGAKYYDPIMNPNLKCGISYADPILLECPVQFLSASGEIAHDGDELIIHIHATFADSRGNAYGGHLSEDGNQALNTINIYIGIIKGVDMGFELDEELGLMALCPKEA
jgi:predicted DNA-binding protein with PD1-like motif